MSNEFIEMAEQFLKGDTMASLRKSYEQGRILLSAEDKGQTVKWLQELRGEAEKHGYTQFRESVEGMIEGLSKEVDIEEFQDKVVVLQRSLQEVADGKSVSPE